MGDLVIKRVDAFTTNPFGGNPAGVIHNAGGLAPETMQSIAAEMRMNLMETAFIVMSEGTRFKVRFFTPTEEVDLSGHVLIASCFSLIEEGEIPRGTGLTEVIFETKVGDIPVEIYFKPDRHAGEEGTRRKSKIGPGDEDSILEKIMISQSIQDYYTPAVSVDEVASILGIDAGEIVLADGLPLEIITTPLNVLMVPVRHKDTIMNMHPDLIMLELMNRRSGIDNTHVFSLDTFDQSCTTYSRHFAPARGVWEDPGTGTASAALGTYLLRHGVTFSRSMVMEQGNELGSLSRILVEVGEASGASMPVKVGGLAVTSITRELGSGSRELHETA